jgi:hypothetical protein
MKVEFTSEGGRHIVGDVLDIDEPSPGWVSVLLEDNKRLSRWSIRKEKWDQIMKPTLFDNEGR